VAKFEGAQEQIAKLHRYQHLVAEKRSRRGGSDNSDSGDHSYEFYVVQRGDNLSTISKRLGLSTRKLMRINGLRRNRIHPGQRLKYYSPASAVIDAHNKKRGPASTEAVDPAEKGLE
jgi:LysM domain